MISIDYVPQGVCSKNIHVMLDDEGKTIESIQFKGGCPGNLAAISKLVAGMPVDFVVEKLEGNTCGARATSCADQLSKALVTAAEQARA